MSREYRELKKKYCEFVYPMVMLQVGDKSFGDNKNNLVLSEVSVELSCGLEASAASFSIYGVYDVESGQYAFSKFKDFVQLGSTVTISMGYGGVMEEVFVGFIAQTRFVRSDSDIHHVEVTAMDVKGLMMANSYARQMTAGNYGDAVKEIFRKPMYQRMNADGIWRTVHVDDTPDKTSAQSHQVTSYTVEMVSESDYEFIVKAAKRFNFEFYVDTGDIYFRRAKQAAEECLLEIGMDKGVRGYDITYDITGLVKSVEVRGMDTAKAELVSVVQKTSNKISTGNRAKALISQSEKVVSDASAIAKEQAQYRAQAMMEEISYRFGSLECVCTGIPEIKPGHFIRMTGLGGPCDNRFYVTQARHDLSDEGGYLTYITAIAAALM